MMRLFLLIFAFFLTTTDVYAGEKFCEKADSTAATQACLKRHLDSAQGKLNKVYEQLAATLDEEQQNSLKSLQQKWIDYRDSACTWEQEQSESPSLQKLNELSCLVRITTDRKDILMAIYEHDVKSDIPREYGSFPRWMNVVAKDHPNVAWFYGSREAADLNCDESEEYTMTGLDKKGQLVYAVVRNPEIGRAQADLFTFSNDENAECGSEPSFLKVVKSADEEGNCPSEITVKRKGCDDSKIVWTGKKFETIEIEPEEKEVKKE